MRLLVNITSLIPPITGIGWYTHNLLKGLLASSQIDDIIGAGICRSINRKQLEKKFQQQDDDAKSATLADIGKKIIPYLPRMRQIRQPLQRVTFRRTAKHLKGYIYWEPNYILQPFGEGAAVSTVHDLSHIRYPQHHPAGRLSYLNRHLQESVERARKIVVVSDFTRREVKDVFNVDDDRISVVSPGVAPEFHPRPQEDVLSVLGRYGLKPGYVLSVGTLEPRKNVISLIRSWLRLPRSLRLRHPLVLAGTNGWNRDEFEKELASAESRGEIIRLGYILQDDLPALYVGASILAYISFYEGYGMPVAEAMASGTAVLTSNCASMPEVAGDAAILVDPKDGDSILHGLTRLLEDDVLRQHLGNQGLLRATKFKWGHSLNNLLDVFSKLSV